MREYINCNCCDAPILIDSIRCSYCGNETINSGSSSELILFIREIEKYMIKSNIDDLLQKINKSKFKNHPTILFRKAKVLLIDYMTNDRVLEANEFCEVAGIVNELSKTSNDYWDEFLNYLNK